MSSSRREFSTRLGGTALGVLLGHRAGLAAERSLPARIRVGLVGTRHSHFRGKLEGLRRLEGRFDIVGVAEPDSEARRELARAPDALGVPLLSEEQLMDTEDLTAVVIETREEELQSTAERWIAAGRHVHLEKPPGEALPPFARLLAEAERKELVVQLGYMFRHHPAFELAFRAVREGWLGRIYELHGVIGKVVDAEKRRRWAAFSGGSMYVLGAHLVDAAVAALGKPASVEALVRRTRPEQDDLADNQLAVLSYPGALGTLRSAAVDVEGFARRELAVHGDRGAVTIRPSSPPAYA